MVGSDESQSSSTRGPLVQVPEGASQPPSAGTPAALRGLLGAHVLHVGGRFAVVIERPALAVALAFVTWATTLRRVKLGVVLREGDGTIAQQTAIVRLHLHDWESGERCIRPAFSR